jgi:FtsH-binding integral membrane protein
MRYSIPAHSAGARLDVAATNRVLRNAYLLLALSFLPSVAGAFVGAAFPIFMALHEALHFILFLGAVIGLQMVVIKNRARPAGIGWLFVLTFVMGFFIGPMVGFALNSYSNGAQLVGVALGGTAAIFFAIAGYASVTKRDFSNASIGKMLGVGMIMLIVVMFVNLFLQLSALGLALSSMVIIIMSVYILHIVNSAVRGGETNYILVAMALYIALFNIFQSLLHLLMAFAGNRE